jgi:hypothetical protein
MQPVVTLLAKKLTLHSHGITVDFEVDAAASFSKRPSGGMSATLSFKSSSSGMRPAVLSSHLHHGSVLPVIHTREDAVNFNQSARSLGAELGAAHVKVGDGRRRSSLLSSVRNLLNTKSPTAVAASSGNAPRQDRLINFDVSSVAALDPMSLAGLVQGAADAGSFDASRALALAHRRASTHVSHPPPVLIATAVTTSAADAGDFGGGVSTRKLMTATVMTEDDVKAPAAPLPLNGGRRDSTRRASQVGIDFVPESSVTHGPVHRNLNAAALPATAKSHPPPRSVLRRSSVAASQPEHSGRGWAHSLTDLPRPQTDAAQPFTLLCGFSEPLIPSPAILRAAGKFIPRVSPLTLAVQSHHKDVSSVLLKFGANATKRDGSGLSPYDRSLLQVCCL